VGASKLIRVGLSMFPLFVFDRRTRVLFHIYGLVMLGEDWYGLVWYGKVIITNSYSGLVGSGKFRLGGVW